MAVTIQSGSRGWDPNTAVLKVWQTVPEVFLPVSSTVALNPTETLGARIIRVPGTFKRLASRDDAVGTGRSYRLRKNLADASMIMSLPNAAGTTIDTTHSDHYAAGDKYNAQVQGSVVFGNYWMMIQFFADVGTVTEAVSPHFGQGVTTPAFYWHGQGLGFTLSTPIPQRAAHTAANFQFYVLVANATAFTVVSTKNGLVANATISAPGSTTGLFEDTTHSDSVAAGDTYAMRSSTTGAVTGTLWRMGWSMTYSGGGVASEMEFSPVFVRGPRVSTTFAPLAGAEWGDGTEANAQQTFGFGGTFSRFRLGVDPGGVDTTGSNVLTVRKNGVNQTVILTVPINTSGNFEDTTHTDRFTATDLMCLSIVEAGGTAGSTLDPSSGLFLLTPDPDVLRIPQRHYLRR